ncbi:hypothetical protein ACIHFD_12640 [Nonomuraea sp. NPDC051941]|uniref:hypothetical protein n=1 Tax=Nonomuraea sp. NPDC051941 TaxID=3364373 RepID=UPI0037C8B9B4
MAASIPINDDVTLNVDISVPADPHRQPSRRGIALHGYPMEENEAPAAEGRR